MAYDLYQPINFNKPKSSFQQNSSYLQPKDYLSAPTNYDPLDFSNWELNPQPATSLDFSNKGSNNFWGNLGQGINDWWTSKPLTSKPIFDALGKPTGQMSGSIFGDLASVADFGLKGLNTLNMYGAAKEAKKNMDAQRDAMKTQSDASRLATNAALGERYTRDAYNAADGRLGITEARDIGSKRAAQEMAKYGL